VARSGVALMENGAAVSIQEIYYADQAFGQGQLERTGEIDVNNAGAITENISPLTQFQFNNNIVNARNAETSVTLDLPNDSNPITLDNVQLSDVPLNNAQTASLNSNVLPSQVQIQNSVLLESSSTTAIDMSASEKRASVQAYFQNRIKNEQSDLIVNNDPVNQHHIRQSKPDDLTPSKSLTDSQSFFKAESTQDKKLDDLKLLVENLKLIRERQTTMQDKLNIYHQVGQLKDV
jgi:hypothetical protein